MEDKLVTIRNFCYGPDPVSEAELARIKLEAEGIKCFLAGENFVAMYWLYSGIERGVKLQVMSSDARRALEILGVEERFDFDESEDEELRPEQICRPCPKCGSDNVEYTRFSRMLFYLGILFFSFPLPYLRKKYKCMKCGETWGIE